MSTIGDVSETQDIRSLWNALKRTKHVALAGKALYAGLLSEAKSFVRFAQNYSLSGDEDIALSVIEEILHLVDHLTAQLMKCRDDVAIGRCMARRFGALSESDLLDGREMYDLVFSAVQECAAESSRNQKSRRARIGGAACAKNSYAIEACEWDRRQWKKMDDLRPVCYVVDHKRRIVGVFRRNGKISDCYAALASEYDRRGLFSEAATIRQTAITLAPYESEVLDSDISDKVSSTKWVVDLAERVVRNAAEVNAYCPRGAKAYRSTSVSLPSPRGSDAKDVRGSKAGENQEMDESSGGHPGRAPSGGIPRKWK